jgi:hypothetical protein
MAQRTAAPADGGGAMSAQRGDDARHVTGDTAAEQVGPRETSGRRLLWPILATGLLTVVIVALVASGMSDDGDTTAVDAGAPDDAADRPTSTAPTTTTAVTSTRATASTTTAPIPPASPSEAFAAASRRLETAGSFTYSGTVQATDVSHIRPGLWLATEMTVDGEVALASNRLHEVAVAANAVTETVIDGGTVWGRSATSRDQLADQGYRIVTELTDQSVTRMGAALLPQWLSSATDHRAAGVDAAGGVDAAAETTFRATLPADALGPVVRGQPATSAEVLLSVDADGDPSRVEISSNPAGTLLLVMEITSIGENIAIDVPTDPAGG